MISEVVQTEAIEEQYLTFMLGENLVGIQLGLVEVIEFVPEIIQIPRAPKYVLGVANIENAIIPILDLELLLKSKSKTLTKKAISIIISIESAVFGVHIAEPPKVVLLESMLQDSSLDTSSNIPKDWIDGFFNDDMDKTITILNPEKFWIGLGKSELTGPASRATVSKKKEDGSAALDTSGNESQALGKKKISSGKETELAPSEKESTKSSNKKKKATKKEAKTEVKKIEELDVHSEDVAKKKSKKKEKSPETEFKTEKPKSEEKKASSDIVDEKKPTKKKKKVSENDAAPIERKETSEKPKKGKDKESTSADAKPTDLSDSNIPSS